MGKFIYSLVSVETEINGEIHLFSSDIVVVACGAINSAALLLRSANEQHPNGLGNNSDQVGRNLMKHQNGAINYWSELKIQSDCISKSPRNQRFLLE